MDVKNLFGEIATSLSHLRSALENQLMSDQKAQLDAAVVKLRDTEANFEAEMTATVAAKVKEAIDAGLETFSASVSARFDDMGARVTATEAFGTRIDDLETGIANIDETIKGLDTLGGDSSTNTLLGGQADDSILAGAGNDVIDPAGGAAAAPGAETAPVEEEPAPEPIETEAPAAPVAVISTDPADVAPTITEDSTHDSVIVTDHPTDGTTLVTPITSTDHDPDATVVVDPATGVPTPSDPASGLTLGETVVAAPETPAAADLATDPSASIVSAIPGDGA